MWRTAPPSAPGAANTPTATTAKLLSTARVRLAARRWDDARRIAEQILQREPDDPAALLIAGEAATRLEQFSDALKYYAGVSPAHPEQYLLAIRTAAEIHRVHGSLDEAEKLFRTALQLTPDDPPTLTHLATLLMLTARPGAARPVLLRLLEIGAAGPQQLQWLADSERPAKAAGYLERSLEISPDQVFPRLGLANLLRLRGETAAAEALLSALRQQMPQQPEIERSYARCLLEQERFSDLATWWSELSDHARNGADNWSIAGVVCESRQQPREACRCYLECLQRN
ncbi:MAG TPA: tetratricopeptide repeat protein, partial [Planctomycetaceae bacterium]|nr:tetratricopeptide repeat protein [Planctomycetaceae bacterium]